MSKTPNVFLVQVSEPGSTNILNNNKYMNENWYASSKDKDHGDVRVGDLLLIYFTGRAINFEKQLKQVYRVENIQNNNEEFSLKKELELNPIPLSTIRESVATGVLPDVFLNCGRQGFNIRKINYSDYEKVLQLAKTLPTAPPIVGTESLLEDFIVNNWNPIDFFGEEFSKLEIVKDESGNVIGQQYDTHDIGIIDLLCINQETGEYVVIENKRGPETSDDVIGQLARYMGWVKKNLAKEKKVIGIIITSGYDVKLLYAASVIPNVKVMVYKMQFEIKAIT